MSAGAISVMIVEDEALMRVGIHAVVDRLDAGYEVVAEADNGLDAVKTIGAVNPDIVMLDITLPGIDGLEVLRRVRSEGYRGHILILTCHEDFQMARQAVRDGADDYVLKSEVNGENLITYLKRMAQLPRTGKTAGDLPAEQKRNVLLNLLSVGAAKGMNLAGMRERYRLKLTESNLFLILVQINDYTDVIGRYLQKDRDTFAAGLHNVLETAFAQYPEHELVQKEPDLWVGFVSFSSEVSTARVGEHLKNLVEGVRSSFETFLNVGTAICISLPVRNIERVNAEFERARKLLDEQFFFPQKWLLRDDQSRDEDGFAALLNTLKQDLRAMQAKKSPLEPLKAVNRFLEDYRSRQLLPDKNAFLYVINDFLEDLAHRSDSPNRDVRAENQTLEQLLNKLAEVQDCAGDASKPRNYLVAQAQDYIGANFMRDINLDVIADHIGVSPSYISRIFSRVTGENVSAYIMNRRIEYAKQLLRTTSLKQYEIAEKCGLNSAAYFTSTFKKYTGLTPNQFRNSHK